MQFSINIFFTYTHQTIVVLCLVATYNLDNLGIKANPAENHFLKSPRCWFFIHLKTPQNVSLLPLGHLHMPSAQ